jgi:hypothetical protein
VSELNYLINDWKKLYERTGDEDTTIRNDVTDIKIQIKDIETKIDTYYLKKI